MFKKVKAYIKNKTSVENVERFKSFYPLSWSKILLLIQKHNYKNFGLGSTVHYSAVIAGKKEISVGKFSDIGAFVHVWGNGGVEIGNEVLIASHVAITTLTHDYTTESLKFGKIIFKSIIISDGAWLGAHSVVMPGVKIGKGAIVGAGAVVTKNVPDMAIVVGSPARIIKCRSLDE